MSRSRKKTPCCNVVKPDGSWKRIYNRSLRRRHLLDVPSGNYYRKMHESYRIHDCRDVGTTFFQYSAYSNAETEAEMRNDYEWYYIRK